MASMTERFTEKHHYAWLIFIGCCFLQAGGMGIIMNCLGLFWVSVSTDLSFSRATVTTFMMGYFAANIVIMPFAGNLLSKAPIRRVVSLAAVGAAVTLVLMSRWTVDEAWQFPVAGFFIGMFGTCLFVLPAASMIGNWFVKRRGIVYGVTMSFSNLAAALMAPLFNLGIANVGWRWTYVLIACLSLALILPWSTRVFVYRPEDIGLEPYGYRADETGRGFVRSGVSAKEALTSLSFVCLFLFAGISAFCHSGIDSHLPGFVITVGLSQAFGAMMVSAMSIGSIIDKLVMGYLNDRIGVQRTTFFQLAMVAFGLSGFLIFRSPALLILSAVFTGAQDSLMSVSVPLLIRQIFGSRNYTVIHSWVRVGIGVFGGTSATIVGALFDRTGVFTPAIYVGIALYLLSALLVAVAFTARKRLHWEMADTEARMQEEAGPLQRRRGRGARI